MNVQYETHAQEVVERFKRMLDADQQEAIGDEHFSELETLVSAALGVVDSNTKHAAAKQVETLAHDLRKDAGNV